VWLPSRLGACDSVLLGIEDEPRTCLARDGYDVYSVDYRTHFVDPHRPDAVAACARWSIGTLIDDVVAVIRTILDRHPDRRIVLIGHSFGAKLAYLCATRMPPDRLAGLVALDGWLRDDPEAVTGADRDAVRWAASQPVPAAFAATRQIDPASNRVRRILSSHLRQQITAADTGWAGRMCGRAADDATADLVARCLLEGDHCWPATAELEARAMAVDLTLAGVARYDAEIDQISVPLLNIMAGDRGHAFTRRALHTGRLLTRTHRRELVLDGWGHMDVVMGGRFGERIHHDVASWLTELPHRPVDRRTAHAGNAEPVSGSPAAGRPG
jgi:pimeloyl-ACP methyl ester carboxylesterase